MTKMSQEIEYNVLGCKVRLRPDQTDNRHAKTVIDLVNSEIQELKTSRPMLRDTDLAVLVALKLQLEDEFKESLLKLEGSLETALQALNSEVN
jgi:cell division protein ZapA (FtsZ GTPase activity inhibitor)